MFSKTFLCRVASISLGLSPFMLGTAQADVTMQEHLAVEGSGLMAMANMSGTSTTSVSGKHSRIESDLVMESRLVRMFARNAGQHTEIVRLDDDKVLELDVKKKTYEEVSLADRRAQLAKAMEQQKEAQEKQPAPTGIDESQCDWSEPTVDVKKTGEKATIAGFSADHITILGKQSCKDRKTGAVCEVAVSLDQWLAPGFDNGEMLQFQKAYAQSMGLTTDGRDVTQRAEALLGRYKGVWTKVADKLKDTKGYPVKTSFAFGIGGAQCKDASAQSAQSGGASGGAESPSAIASQIAGSIFGRKKKAAAEQTAAATPPPVGMENMITPLRISSELISVSKDSLPASTFEVPPGFKKVAP